MTKLLRALRAIQRPLNILLDVIGVVLLVLLVVIITQEVFNRYVFNNPGKWSEELSIAMLIWFGYLGITVGYRDDKHLCITIFADRLGGTARKLLDTFADLVMLTFCLLMAWQGVKVAEFDAINIMPATGIPMSYVSCVLVVSGVAMIFEAILKILARFVDNGVPAATEAAA